MYFKDEHLYHKLKYIAQVVLPAFATLYFTVAGLWELPYPDEISKTIIAIDTFMGIVLRISEKNYQNAEGENNENE